jgi:hypothetical protein
MSIYSLAGVMYSGPMGPSFAVYFADVVQPLGLKNAPKLHNSSSRNKYIVEMVVTEIILAKSIDFISCRVTVAGFLLAYGS